MKLASRHKDFAVKKSLSSVEENHEWTSAKTSKATSTQKNFLTRSQSFTESLNQSIVQYLLSYSIDWIIATYWYDLSKLHIQILDLVDFSQPYAYV